MNNTNTQIVNEQSTINFSEDDRRINIGGKEFIVNKNKLPDLQINEDEVNTSPEWYREEVCERLDRILEEYHSAMREYRDNICENEFLKDVLKGCFSHRLDTYFSRFKIFLKGLESNCIKPSSFRNIQVMVEWCNKEYTGDMQLDIEAYGNEAEDIHLLVNDTLGKVYSLMDDAKECEETGIYF